MTAVVRVGIPKSAFVSQDQLDVLLSAVRQHASRR
jgi:hypothetical protein